MKEIQNPPDEWLTAAEAKRNFKLSNTKFWGLVGAGCFKAYRPDPTPKSRLTRFRRAEIHAFFLTGIKTGYPNTLTPDAVAA